MSKMVSIYWDMKIKEVPSDYYLRHWIDEVIFDYNKLDEDHALSVHIGSYLQFLAIQHSIVKGFILYKDVSFCFGGQLTKFDSKGHLETWPKGFKIMPEAYSDEITEVRSRK